MTGQEPAGASIIITDRPIPGPDLARLVACWFSDMVKYVVDIERGIVAVGGELHADAEQLLLERGHDQHDLWGANYHPGLGAEDCIEYTSLINIRPSRGNPGMLIEDAEIRARVRDCTFELIGRGEPLP